MKNKNDVENITYLVGISIGFEDEEKPLDFTVFNKDMDKVEIYTRTVMTLQESFGTPETDREVLLFCGLVQQVVENSWNQIYKKLQGF